MRSVDARKDTGSEVLLQPYWEIRKALIGRCGAAINSDRYQCHLPSPLLALPASLQGRCGMGDQNPSNRARYIWPTRSSRTTYMEDQNDTLTAATVCKSCKLLTILLSSNPLK